MSQSPYKILVVDDEPDITEFLSYNLRKEGFQVDSAPNGRKAIERALQIKPDLILMDVMMPVMDGIEATGEIRSIPQLGDTLIAFLSARAEDYTQIAGFNAGADDFIAKPIRPKVLISRINALLKRKNLSPGRKASETDTDYRQFDNISLDTERYVLKVGNKQTDLPKKEFNLLHLLTSKPGRVFTRQEIFHHLWGDEVIVSDRTIDVYIRKIREKVGDSHIKTIKGVGYSFEA
jgi:two-component system alkaline phosphatase synthesis response regulator PhoP